MLYLFLVLIISIIVGVLLLKLVATVRSKFDQYQENSIIDLFMDFPKSCAAVLVLVVLYGFYLVSHQIGSMYTCAVRSSSQNVETDYSWYFDKCRFKNKDGAWVDIERILGTPDGDDHAGQ